MSHLNALENNNQENETSMMAGVLRVPVSQRRKYSMASVAPQPMSGPVSTVGGNEVSVVESSQDLHKEFYHLASLSKLEDEVIMLMLSLQDSEPNVSRRAWFMSFLFHVVVLWMGLFTGMQPDYNYGEYGQWIVQGLNYVNTLGVDHLPYVAAVVVASIVFACLMVGLVNLYVAYRSVVTMSKHWPKVKLVTRYLNGVLCLLCMPICWLMFSFLDCDYGSAVVIPPSTSAIQVLHKYPHVACYGSSNIGMMVLAGISLVIMFVSLLFGVAHLVDVHPESNTLFASYHSHIILLTYMTSILFYLVACLVSRSFVIIQAVFYLFSKVFLLLLVLYSVPFYRRWENSVYVGYLSGCVGCGICGIVSVYVNRTNDWELGLGLVGITLATIITFFLIGFVSFELWSRTIVNGIKNVFMDHLERGLDSLILSDNLDFVNPKIVLEREALNVLHEIEERGITRHLFLFLKWCVRTGVATSLGNLKELEMAKCFIKGVANQKTYQNVDLLIVAGMISGHFVEGQTQAAIMMLEKASKNQPNLVQRYLIALRLKEVEVVAEDGRQHLEVKHILQTIEQKHMIILALHKSFWKELLAQSLSLDKIESLNKEITSLTNECELVLHNLMSNYGNNKTVLRAYAKFLKEIHFNKEKSSELYEEATTIEEEETRKVSYFKKRSQKKQNKVVPEKSAVVELTRKPSRYASSQSNFDDKNLADQSFDGIDSENNIMKKEYQIKNSLNRNKGSNLVQMMILVLSLFSLAILTTSVALSVSFTNTMGQNVDVAHYACLPQVFPYYMLREIRIQQNFINIFPHYETYLKESSLSNTNSSKEYTQAVIFRVGKYLESLEKLKEKAKLGYLSSDSISDFTSSVYPIYYPVALYNTTFNAPPTYQQYRNASISEITDSLIQYTKLYLQRDFDNFNETTTSENFMYFWMNRNHSDAYSSFCHQFIKRNEEQFFRLENQFVYFYSLCISLYIVGALVFLIIATLKLRYLRQSLTFISKAITKDHIGKIYHSLESKVDDDFDVKEQNVFSKPQIVVSVLVICTIFLTLCSMSMLFLDFYLSSKSASNALRNIQNGVEILRSSNTIEFRLNELFTFLRYPSGSHLNDDRLLSRYELDLYHKENKYLTGIISVSWDQLQYNADFVSSNSDLNIILFKSTNCTNSTTLSCSFVSELISNIVTSSNKFAENVYYSDMSMIQLFMGMLSLTEVTNTLMEKFSQVLDIYSLELSTPKMILTIVFSIVGYFTLIGLAYLTYTMLGDVWNQNHQLRVLLNYLPISLFDSNEELKAFALFNQLPNKFKSRDKSSEEEKDGNAKIRTILNSTVDGSVVCNSKGDIELFNPSAQKMFGMNPSDVLGEPLTKLFDPLDVNSQKIAEVINQMVNSTQPFGEIMEVACLRKNQTKFPGKINLFVSIFNKKPIISCFIKDFTPEKKQNMLLAEEKKKSETLLLNIMPESVASRLKAGDTFIAEKFNDVTVFFSDMVGFTKISSGMNPSELVMMLNTIVNGFDVLTDRYSLEKIKTIGDAYFCVGGISNLQSDHPERTLRFAIDTMSVIRDYNYQERTTMNIRIGLHTGPVVAGVIGLKKFAYDCKCF